MLHSLWAQVLCWACPRAFSLFDLKAGYQCFYTVSALLVMRYILKNAAQYLQLKWCWNVYSGWYLSIGLLLSEWVTHWPPCCPSLGLSYPATLQPALYSEWTRRLLLRPSLGFFTSLPVNNIQLDYYPCFAGSYFTGFGFSLTTQLGSSGYH